MISFLKFILMWNQYQSVHRTLVYSKYLVIICYHDQNTSQSHKCEFSLIGMRIYVEAFINLYYGNWCMSWILSSNINFSKFTNDYRSCIIEKKNKMKRTFFFFFFEKQNEKDLLSYTIMLYFFLINFGILN